MKHVFELFINLRERLKKRKADEESKILKTLKMRIFKGLRIYLCRNAKKAQNVRAYLV